MATVDKKTGKVTVQKGLKVLSNNVFRFIQQTLSR